MSFSVFSHKDYKNLVRDYVETRPKGGRGEWGRIAKAMGVNATMVSQVFNGDKNLSLEQGCELVEYMGLNPLESEYLLVLLQLERSGSVKLSERLQRRRDEILSSSSEVKNRLGKPKQISNKEKAQFYSSWLYSACRILSSIPDYQEVNAIAEYLKMPVESVQDIVNFLVETGMCEQAEGKITIGELRTHVDSKSVMVATHHRNWRLRAMERAQNVREDELMFTAPLSISKKNFKKVRARLLDCIQEISEIVEESDPELACCLNIDWIEFST